MAGAYRGALESGQMALDPFISPGQRIHHHQ